MMAATLGIEVRHIQTYVAHLGLWSWQIPAQQWAWNVTLRRQQREAPLNRTGPSLPRPIAVQLCPFMVAARLMTLLWPALDIQQYPCLREEDMPGIQRCFFGTLNCLQHSDLQVSGAKVNPPLGSWPTRTSKRTR